MTSLERQEQYKRIGYSNIHSWLRSRYGRASRCEADVCVGPSKRFEWALKRGCFYAKDRGCFLQLCGKCHRKYDNAGFYIRKAKIGVKLPKETCLRMSRAQTGVKRPYRQTAIYSFDGTNKVYYDSIKEATKATGIKRNAISQSLYGRRKLGGGLKWSYQKINT